LPLSDERIDVMIGRFRLLAAVPVWPVVVLAASGDANYMDGNAVNGYGHMDGYGHMMNSWGGAAVMWILLLIVIVVLIWFLVRGSGTGGFQSTPRETPLDILKKRYARGEITKEQFDEMKKDL